MQSVFIDISKYIFAGIIALYTLASYNGAIMRKEERIRKVCTIQNILMFSMHLFCAVCIFICNFNDF